MYRELEILFEPKLKSSKRSKNGTIYIIHVLCNRFRKYSIYFSDKKEKSIGQAKRFIITQQLLAKN